MNPPRYRQLRGRLTGGADDVMHFWAALREFGLEEHWAITWEEFDSFGDVGPLHKMTFGFTSTDETDL